ncbi:DUF2478 domain-containing protein [Novosphingobium naphthalenivorans]|uniref:DUF2478 domain-containing protein n=1 Tax=Novosphingobium naphthalenivorans TaxID=273168 RepID=UPI00082FBD1D|nr:DUF2478 domain-containing protein [Novosphingobium naphthalenivorans]
MSAPVCPIAVIQDADAPEIQRCFADLVRHIASIRIAGVIEVFDSLGADGACKRSFLRSFADEQVFSLFQELGQAADACALLPEGLISAAHAVCRDISRGCDLLILSKFGKLEAENGSGLVPAFVAALEAGVPILTSVSPRYRPAWETFATPLFSTPGCSDDVLDSRWARLQKQKSSEPIM